MAYLFHFETFVSWSYSPKLSSTIISQLVLPVASSQNQRKFPLALSATLDTRKTAATYETLLNSLQPEVLPSLLKFPVATKPCAWDSPACCSQKGFMHPYPGGLEQTPPCQIWGGPCSSARTWLWNMCVAHTTSSKSSWAIILFWYPDCENYQNKPPSSQAITLTFGLDWTTPGGSGNTQRHRQPRPLDPYSLSGWAVLIFQQCSRWDSPLLPSNENSCALFYSSEE